MSIQDALALMVCVVVAFAVIFHESRYLQLWFVIIIYSEKTNKKFNNKCCELQKEVCNLLWVNCSRLAMRVDQLRTIWIC